ncbi:MAG: S9 family peptidase, partial [Alphaproteobacteria bacterium]|nr:S9 family peptidase [Alphaproteobacteria bacterium]
MRKLVLGFISAIAVLTVGVSLAKDSDPFLWLEEVEGAKALTWVRAQNDRSLKLLQADPRYEDLHAKALAILEAKDRVPQPGFRAKQVFNFWQDDVNVRGLLRRTSIETYRDAAPTWETVLDIDALAKTENANWVYKGAACLAPAETQCLVSLSDGGKDAVEIREFDTTTKTFPASGFRLAAGKQDADWLDADTLYVARDWGPGTMTESGYPFVTKLWKRGTKLEDAKEVYRGKATDVGAGPSILRDSDGVVQAVMFVRNVSFFETEFYLSTETGPVRLPFPLKSTIQTLVSGQLVFTIEQDWSWKGTKYAQGALLSFDLAELKRDTA